MIKKLFLIFAGLVVFIVVYLLVLALIIFLSDILKINLSVFSISALIIPFFTVYWLFSKILKKEESLKLSIFVLVIGVISVIGSCGILVLHLANAPNYW